MGGQHRRRRDHGKETKSPAKPEESYQKALQQALHRLLHINEISKLLTRFESIEQTVPAVVALLTRTLSLRSAIFLVSGSERSLPFVWQAGDSSESHQLAAKSRASRALAYLARSGSNQKYGAPALIETSGGVEAPGDVLQSGGNFIVLPLVVADRPIFGALQIEGVEPLDEQDLVFVNAVVNQLAIALDRKATLEAGQANSEMKRSTAEDRSVASEKRALVALLQATDARRTLKEQQRMLLQSERLAGIGRLAAGVAHEINNPLGVILGYVRILRRNSDAGLDEELKIIEEEAVRCKEIVEGLLDLARPIQGEPQPADLAAIVAQAVTWLRAADQSRNSSIFISGTGVAMGSPQKIWQVVINLLKNATEAAGTGGQVRVSIGPTAGGFVRMAVEDDGPGLPAGDLQQKLFEPFFSTKASGTGLGLAVSRAIVQGHGGSLDAFNSPTGGAVFIARLPAWVVEPVQPDGG